MISTTSLQAFSSLPPASATSRTAGAQRQPLAEGVEQARAQQAMPAGAQAIPSVKPGVAPPRGSLLNLSV